MTYLFYLVPAAAVVALLFAWIFFRQMKRESEGTPTMKEIAQYVREGAMAYLRQQYKVVVIVFAVLAVLFAVLAYVFHVQNPWVPFAFLTGGFFSGLAGFVGMKTATFASARTANATMRSLNSGLKIAFRSGAVMGLTVVGLGLLDIAIWWSVLKIFYDPSDAQNLVIITTTMLTFGMGASTLEKEVFPAFMVEMPKLTKDTYTFDEFIAMVKANPDLAAVRVHKQRFGYMVNNTICEVGNVLINGAKVVTINSESTEIEDIKKTVADCHLEGVENINYLQAIKRVIGMSDKPLANE